MIRRRRFGIGSGGIGIGIGSGSSGQQLGEKALLASEAAKETGGEVGLDLWEERGVWSSSPMFGLIFDVE